MSRRVRWFFISSAVLVTLAGCGRGVFNYAERAPWRREAEVACLNSGTIKETGGLVRISPIEGPGMCGADFPLKVSALGEASALGYGDEPVRPPGSIAGAGRSAEPRWPISQQQVLGAPPSNLQAPPEWQRSDSRRPGYSSAPPRRAAAPAAEIEMEELPPYAQPGAAPSGTPRNAQPLPPLGPPRNPQQPASATPIEVKPAATLACPIVSALDRWFANAVQPMAQKWFNQPVVEIKQISAYSCRGMNGQAGAHIS